MNQAEIYQQEWCKDLIKRLGRYKENEARLKVLETILDKQGLSIPEHLVASYGPTEDRNSGLGKPSAAEWEHRERMYEKRLIDAALKSLPELERTIIELRYIEHLNDWHVYDIYLPKKNQCISKSTYYYRKANALKTMGRCLGYKECIRNSDKIWTKFGTQEENQGV